MMIKPGINVLSSCADSRYTLVTMAAKRARMLGENGECLVPCDIQKPVSMAVAEIAVGKVGYIRRTQKVKFDDNTSDGFVNVANSDVVVDENGVAVEK